VVIKKEEDKIEMASQLPSSHLSRRNTQHVGKIKIENLSNHNSTLLSGITINQSS